MKRRLTDEEVYLEWLEIMEHSPPQNPINYDIMVRWIGKLREQDPRINSGMHIVDYINICDEDDDMDSFYGPDYFEEDA